MGNKENCCGKADGGVFLGHLAGNTILIKVYYTFGMGEWRIKSGMENKSCDVKKRSFFRQKMLRQGFCVTHFSAL